MKQKAYIVNWVDSASHEGWTHTHDLENVGVCDNQTIGFYVREDNRSITLALNRALLADYAPYGGFISIPKSCISKKRLVRL